MTNREFLTIISNTETISAELRTKAGELIDALDKRNAQRKDKPTKAQVANEGTKASIAAVLANGDSTAAEVAAALGISTQKASALLRQLVAEGVATAGEVKVKGKGKVKVYAIVADADAE